MYEELVKKLRYCGNAVSCLNCPYWEGCAGSKEALTEAADAIEKLSREVDIENDALTAMYGALPKWIPVSERLPKKPDGYPRCELRRCYYLVALKSGCVESLAFDFDRNEWHYTGSPVVAWMPLPPPPKEEA